MYKEPRENYGAPALVKNEWKRKWTKSTSCAISVSRSKVLGWSRVGKCHHFGAVKVLTLAAKAHCNFNIFADTGEKPIHFLVVQTVGEKGPQVWTGLIWQMKAP